MLMGISGRYKKDELFFQILQQIDFSLYTISATQMNCLEVQQKYGVL